MTIPRRASVFIALFLIPLLPVSVRAHSPAEEMTAAAANLLAALSPEQPRRVANE